MPNLFDVIELTTDIPDRGLRAGMRGTIVECHPGDMYEVEFANDLGETLDFLALHPEQFVIVWRVETRAWVPLTEQIATVITRLPEEAGREVLDFARFLHSRRQPSEFQTDSARAGEGAKN